MRRWLFVGFAMMLGWSGVVSAQESAGPTLTRSQRLGRRLFGQDCGVCHTPPTITSGLYGPALSGDLVKGNEAAIADFISHGDNRMPGFQYYYTPAQIQAIVDYLSIVPKPAPAQAPSAHAAAAAGGE